jgi:hypothetical protein
MVTACVRNFTKELADIPDAFSWKTAQFNNFIDFLYEIPREVASSFYLELNQHPTVSRKLRQNLKKLMFVHDDAGNVVTFVDETGATKEKKNEKFLAISSHLIAKTK